MPIEPPPPGRRPSRSLIPWVPPTGGGTELVAAGVWWDAVRVRVGLGQLALEHLGTQVGAVLRDPCDQRLYFLTRPQATVGWRFGCHASEVQTLSTATWIAVPPRERTRARGPHWLIPTDDGEGRLLTPPLALHAAVHAALTEALGPRREPAGEPSPPRPDAET